MTFGDFSDTLRRDQNNISARGGTPMHAIPLLFAAALLTGSWIGDSAAAELKVLSVIPMRPSLQELTPAFEASSGHKLKIEYATAGAVEQKIVNDEEVDVVI